MILWFYPHARWTEDNATRRQTIRCASERQPAGGDCVAHVDDWECEGRWVVHQPAPRRGPSNLFRSLAVFSMLATFADTDRRYR